MLFFKSENGEQMANLNEIQFFKYIQFTIEKKNKQTLIRITSFSVDPPLSTKCELPVVAGPCEALDPRYYYNSSTRRCEQFSYGGCCGNANNFETLAACTNACPSNSYK